MTDLSADLALADAEARASRERVTVDELTPLPCPMESAIDAYIEDYVMEGDEGKMVQPAGEQPT